MRAVDEKKQISSQWPGTGFYDGIQPLGAIKRKRQVRRLEYAGVFDGFFKVHRRVP